MQKRKSLIQIIIVSIVIMLIFAGIFATILKTQYKSYIKIVNSKINSIISNVIDKYPEVKEEEILKIVNSQEDYNIDILGKYGYEDEIANIRELKESVDKNIRNTTILAVIFGIICLIMLLIYIFKQEKGIEEINEYINQVNNGNYSLKIEDNTAGELSRLRNELYKTTIILKEAAQNSEKEKEDLSVAIADISHQLKTPLTSVRIMLDNINDNPDMPRELREDFILEISKQIDWMSSLVIALLKIAKFDAGTIKMENSPINVKELIENVINNLSILIELKNIEIVTNIDEKATFIGDYKWQQEAITNILKNAIEHSNQNSKIYITVENTNFFLKIKIKDEGQGIDKKDLKHIFERFYKAKNSSEESIGIGLALSKAIIEKNNGYIKVESEVGKGTTFEIKFMK